MVSRRILGFLAGVAGALSLAALFLLRPAGAFSAILTPSNTTTVVYGLGSPPIPQQDGVTWRFNYPAMLASPFSGEDVHSLDSYPASRLGFDATFFCDPNPSAGFDEMVVFLTSTLLYNGTEVGIRCDIRTGQIFAYTQEGSPSFQEVVLGQNDKAQHHYDIVLAGKTATFFIDSVQAGILSITVNDYSAFSYWPTALAHRYTAGWSSVGYFMMAGNIVPSSK